MVFTPLYSESNAFRGVRTVQNDKAYIAYLAGRARLGDGTAFARLVQHFGQRLFAHVYRLLSHREEARDAVPAATIRLFYMEEMSLRAVALAMDVPQVPLNLASRRLKMN